MSGWLRFFCASAGVAERPILPRALEDPRSSTAVVSAVKVSRVPRVPSNAVASRSEKPDLLKAFRTLSVASPRRAAATSKAGAMLSSCAAFQPPVLTALVFSKMSGASVLPSCTEISGPPTAATASAPAKATRSASVSALVRLRAFWDSCNTSSASRRSAYSGPGTWIDAATVASGPPRRERSSYDNPSRMASKKNRAAYEGSCTTASRTRVRHLAMAAFLSSWSP
mmetsp:Transcript_19911/g.79367  ORF Transcript_19911/g.79367 Transcript_19911/m.79367 type:complete len:226 (+) Transcript_19911:1129-1806(+)